MKAPKYLRETKYHAPTEPTDGFVQYANQTKLNIFEYLQSIPTLFQDFNMFMGNTMGAREYWHEWYDVEGRLLTGFDSGDESVLLVDVGGGKGHDLVAFDASFGKHPRNTPGKLVLQDLPPVIDTITPDGPGAGITAMPHDFFTEQPVKGKHQPSSPLLLTIIRRERLFPAPHPP
jgi:hypothetical protein